MIPGVVHWIMLKMTATRAVATSRPSLAVRVTTPRATRWTGRGPAVSGIARVLTPRQDVANAPVRRGGCETGRASAPGSHGQPSGAGDRGELRSAARRAPRRQEPSLLASYSRNGFVSKRILASLSDLYDILCDGCHGAATWNDRIGAADRAGVGVAAPARFAAAPR